MTQPLKKKRNRTSKEFHSQDLYSAPRPAPSQFRPGSIEQHLDMYESGPLRGDEILHHHGLPPSHDPRPPLDELPMLENFQINMSDERREGDEESGDEHSAGLQGDDQQELQYDTESPGDADSGAPGEMTEILAHKDPTRKGYRKRAA